MATPAGEAGKSRPWTERSEGSGSAPPAESVHPQRKSNQTIVTILYFIIKMIVEKIERLRVCLQSEAPNHVGCLFCIRVIELSEND